MGQRSFEEGAGLFDAATLPAEHQAAVAAALAANPAVDMGQGERGLLAWRASRGACGERCCSWVGGWALLQRWCRRRSATLHLEAPRL